MLRLLVLMLISGGAYADVYVSPYKGDGSVRYASPPPIKAAPKVDESIVDGSKRSDVNKVRREDLGQGGASSAGRDIPLKTALEMVYPSDAWKYNIDPEVGEDATVSWTGGGGKDGVMQEIAKQNGLYIAVNSDDNTVGVSRDSNIAHLLANRIPQVWFVLAGTDLHTLVRNWASIAGKQVGFKVSDNYHIDYPATIEGTFVDALNQLLASVADERVPLIAERATNGVFRIVRGGWQAP